MENALLPSATNGLSVLKLIGLVVRLAAFITTAFRSGWVSPEVLNNSLALLHALRGYHNG